MKYANLKTPETKRLAFKYTDLEDAALVFALRSSPIVRKYIMQPLAKKEEEAITHINKLIYNLNENIAIAWTLIDKTSIEKIGSICLWNFSEDKKTAEVGYDLLPDYFNKGYMSEALEAVIHFGFNKFNLNTIEAFTHIENEPSKKVLEKNGFMFQPERKDEGFPKNVIYTLEK